MINNLFRISLLLLCTLSARIGAGETKKNPFELLICDYVKFELLKVNISGEVTWKYKPKSKVWDFVLTEDNHIIYPIITKHFEVHCMDFQNKLKWSWDYGKDYREIINITRNKSQIILSGQKPSEAIIMDLSGNILRKIDIPTNYKSHHGEMGDVHALDNGRYLVQLWGEGSVSEVDQIGKEFWRYQVPKLKDKKQGYPAGCVQDVLRFKNGNTMIACGVQARLLEIDRNKNIVWEFNKNDFPELNMINASNLQHLKDGSILVSNFLRGNTGKGAHAFILSKDRKVTWSFKDHKTITAASRVWAIE